jgi:UDP-N-acetylglucosamine 4,6-dehydratase
MLKDKTVLITGGTGSFGKKATAVILQKYKPKKIIIFSRDELKQFEMSQIYPMSDYPMRYFIGAILLEMFGTKNDYIVRFKV